MRTDAKIGFAIGGVLLAVLTVYAIVVPKHKKTTAGTVTLVTPPAQNLNSTSTGVVPPAVAESTATATPPLPAMGEEPSPAAKEAFASPTTTTPPVTTPAVPPLASASNKNLTDDGVFYPAGKSPEATKPAEQKAIVDADPVPSSALGSAKKHSKIHPAAVKPESTDDSNAVASSSDGHPYTIKAGQTLSKIASEVYGNSRFWVAIQRENKGLDANHLKVGSRIMLPDISPLKPGPIATVSDDQPMLAASSLGTPDTKSYTVKSGDSLYGICKRLFGTGRKADALYAMNKDKIGPDKSRLKLGMVLALPETPTLVAQRP